MSTSFKSFNQSVLPLKKIDADIMESMFAIHNQYKLVELNGVKISTSEFNFYHAMEFMNQVSQLKFNHREIKDKMKEFRERCIQD